jgi:hypothetical protein
MVQFEISIGAYIYHCLKPHSILSQCNVAYSCYVSVMAHGSFIVVRDKNNRMGCNNNKMAFGCVINTALWWLISFLLLYFLYYACIFDVSHGWCPAVASYIYVAYCCGKQ